ncbi:hypothetical protein CTRI78_v011473 [Colletotrichum trifolii]|uniref:Uncharacterized protein n=1 Tax=Colletotrichum trifolii TaxID=5466 RepID=A0A4R8QJ04_COLTR|nr:hypothetical protein CTRI78_v011473 [Colletotrichum trifolii]
MIENKRLKKKDVHHVQSTVEERRENRDINKRRSPLLPSPKNLRKPPPQTLWSRSSAVSLSPTGRASSTLGRASTLGPVEILKNGTVFGNSMVLKEDIPNSDLNSMLF